MRLSYEGDLEQAQAFLPRAQQQLDRLRERMQLEGRDQGSFQFALSDTAYCYGYILPTGLEAVHIVTEPQHAELTTELTETTLPDFVSGVIIDGTITPGARGAPDSLATFYPMAQSVAAHPKELRSGANTSTRLAVRLGPTLDELGPPEGSPVIYSQYTRLKPGMFSGKMREIVQILMGFGRLPEKARAPGKGIYDDVLPDLPEDDPDDPPVVDTPHANDVRTWGRRILFDYRFARTHGIVRDNHGLLWLVEVGMTRGVIAMPLPIDPHTQLPEFAEKVANANDADGARVLQDYGGFPTGESFPGVAATFQAYKRAGRIIELATAAAMHEFYQHNAYSQGLGWCFNDSGTECHNTCWDFNDEGIQRGYHFALNLTITGTPDPERTAAQKSAAGSLKQVLGPLSTDPAVADTYEPVLWKIDRMSEEQLAAAAVTLATATTLLEGFHALDALELDPLGNGTTHPSIAGEGYIWWPTKYPPQIKFPDYTLRFLLSHDMRTDFRFLADGVPCDTTMHVYFVGDELKWCKYFRRGGAALAPQVEGDDAFDIDYNPIGRFRRTTTYGPFGVPAMFYTNDFDDREELGSSQVAERYERRDMGWIAVTGGGVALWAPIGFTNQAGPLVPDFPEGGASENHKTILQKIKWFTYQAWSTTTTVPQLAGAVAVPFFDRCACYYASMTGDNGRSTTYRYSTGYLSSPYIGHFYRETELPHLLEMETQVHQVTDESSPYQAFQDLADEGDWVPHGEPADGALYGADALARVLAQGSTTVSNEPPTRTLTVQLIAKNVGTRQTYTETRRSDDAVLWDSAWFLPSPDPETGLTAYIHAIQNCCGDGLAVSAVNTLNGSTVNFGTPNLPAMRPVAPATLTNPNFVGVVDG